MPDGSLPSHELRFTLVSHNGRVETFYTDSRGRFLITRSQGLSPDAGYTLTVEGDNQAFSTTTVSFKFYNNFIYHIPVFLNPIEAKKVKAAGVIDLAEMDALVPKEARDTYAVAMLALKAGKIAEAANELKKAISLYPRYFRALNDLGVIYMKLNELDNASASFEQALKIAPRVYYPRLNLAVVRTRQAKYKEAISMLSALHKETPDLIEVWVPLADALMADNRLNEAETLLRAALSNDRFDRETMGDAYYKLGLLLNRKQDFAEAVKELTMAVKILPNSARTHLQLGGALLQLNRLDEAERYLIKSYELGGSAMGGAQFLLGELYFKAKKYESAMRAFEQYLLDIPEAPNAAEVRGVIERIRVALGKK
jgi:tetratricopeptide (TPR) repeat protein